MRTRNVAAIALVAALIPLTTSCSGNAAADSGKTVTIKVPQPSAASDTLALKVGADLGIFRKHGIELDMVSAPQVGANQVASLLNGQIDIGFGAVTGTMAATTKGMKVRVVSAMSADNEMDGKTLYDTMVGADSGIKTFKDLEGKTVALNSLNSTWQSSMNEAITKDGGDPAKVKYVQLTFPNQLPALQQKHVDAISTTQPFATQAAGSGATGIGDSQAKALDNQRGIATIVQASEQFLQKNPDAAKRFTEALQEASEYANANPADMRQRAIALAQASGPAAEAINKAPLPFYTTRIDASTIDGWNKLQTKYGFGQEAKPDTVLWAQAPKA